MVDTSYYQQHREHLLEQQRKRYAEHPEVFSKSRLEWAKKHPERQRAQTFSGRYVKAKSNCEKCGATGILDKHHPDYSKPLEVITLCKKCHRALHRELDAQGIVLNVPLKVFENHHCSNCDYSFPSCGRGHPSFKGRSCTLWKEKASLHKENTSEVKTE